MYKSLLRTRYLKVPLYNFCRSRFLCAISSREANETETKILFFLTISFNDRFMLMQLTGTKEYYYLLHVIKENLNDLLNMKTRNVHLLQVKHTFLVNIISAV